MKLLNKSMFVLALVGAFFIGNVTPTVTSLAEDVEVEEPQQIVEQIEEEKEEKEIVQKEEKQNENESEEECEPFCYGCGQSVDHWLDDEPSWVSNHCDICGQECDKTNW